MLKLRTLHTIRNHHREHLHRILSINIIMNRNISIHQNIRITTITTSSRHSTAQQRRSRPTSHRTTVTNLRVKPHRTENQRTNLPILTTRSRNMRINRSRITIMVTIRARTITSRRKTRHKSLSLIISSLNLLALTGIMALLKNIHRTRSLSHIIREPIILNQRTNIRQLNTIKRRRHLSQKLIHLSRSTNIIIIIRRKRNHTVAQTNHLQATLTIPETLLRQRSSRSLNLNNLQHAIIRTITNNARTRNISHNRLLTVITQ